MGVGLALSQARPAPARRLVNLRTPPACDPSRLSPGLVESSEAPRNQAPPPAPVGRGIVKRIQGRSAARDVLIDPDRPEQKLGAVDRGNAIRKAGASHGIFLVRFDLERLGLPAGAKILEVTVGFSGRDPSSQSRTKVCAFPVTTPWDQACASFRQAADGRPWKGDREFALGADTGPAGPP